MISMQPAKPYAVRTCHPKDGILPPGEGPTRCKAASNISTPFTYQDYHYAMKCNPSVMYGIFTKGKASSSLIVEVADTTNIEEGSLTVVHLSTLSKLTTDQDTVEKCTLGPLLQFKKVDCVINSLALNQCITGDTMKDSFIDVAAMFSIYRKRLIESGDKRFNTNAINLTVKSMLNYITMYKDNSACVYIYMYNLCCFLDLDTQSVMESLLLDTRDQEICVDGTLTFSYLCSQRNMDAMGPLLSRMQNAIIIRLYEIANELANK